MLRRTITPLLPILTAAMSGCGSSPALSARMDDAQVRSVLAEHCPPGSTEPQVQSGLDALGVSKGARVEYSTTDTRPHVLLVRLFEDRGPWLDSSDADVKWLDISFIFSGPAPGALDRTLLHRDYLRYVHGEPITGPTTPRRPLQHAPGRWPSPVPPPVDPLEGAS